MTRPVTPTNNDCLVNSGNERNRTRAVRSKQAARRIYPRR
jgi:hypothetical protein